MKRFTNGIVVLLVLGIIIVLAPREPLAQGKRSERAKKSAGELNNKVEITTKGDFREIRSNGIPNHKPGEFPNRHNPNSISEQQYSFRVPLKPVAAKQPARLRLGPFGIALNGVLFDPGAAEFWNDDPQSGWQYEAKGGKVDLGLDDSNAHVQPNGAYHYHGLPIGLIEALGGGEKILLIGYAADGFPVYSQFGAVDPKDAKSKARKMQSSYRVKSGNRPSGPRGKYDGTFVEDYEYVAGAGDLDECNGRFAATPEYPDGIYHYYITEEFPYIPRAWRGTPNQSFRRGPGSGGRGGPPPRKGRPPGKRPPRRPPPDLEPG
jgi:hypothetical protein